MRRLGCESSNNFYNNLIFELHHTNWNVICAAYALASSLVAYVTFTTAVSVSVFTVE